MTRLTRALGNRALIVAVPLVVVAAMCTPPPAAKPSYRACGTVAGYNCVVQAQAFGGFVYPDAQAWTSKAEVPGLTITLTLEQRQRNGDWIGQWTDKRGPISTRHLRVKPTAPDETFTSPNAAVRDFPAFDCQREERTRYRYRMTVTFTGRGHEGMKNIVLTRTSNEVTQ